MKVGDLIRLHSSPRRCGDCAGKPGIIIDIDKHDNPVVNVGGTVKSFHITQIEEVISEGR
jgi:hydrogenase maturation factor